MLLEAINSVFLTFLATEYLLLDDDRITLYQFFSQQQQRSRSLQYTIAGVILINIFVNFQTIGASLVEWIHAKLSQFIHVPRIVVAISSFVLTLYWDCRRNNHVNTITNATITRTSDQYFLKLLVQSFFRLLPIYPFLAVIISFGFLFVITIFERLHLPMEILNMPIYYGTLYG
jgi:hypothetical protein